MRPSDPIEVVPGERAAGLDCTILDAGPNPVDPQEIAHTIRSILDDRLAEFARDRNAICYRARMSRSDGEPETVIVKAPRLGPQRTNDDATFAWEGEILARLPAAGVTFAPALVARVAAAGSHYLFTTELPGRHPDPRMQPLDGPQLNAVLDCLYQMDRRGFMHYDLKAANILIDCGRPGFVDFEFARFNDACSAYAAANAAYCEDFNVSGNPYFPARTNVANFEFRTLHRYLRELGERCSASVADALHREWLRGRSTYHRRMSALLTERAETSAERVAVASGITRDEAGERLLAAGAHEDLLARLFLQPSDAVVRVERLLMAFRCAVFERRWDEACRLQDTTLAEISGITRSGGRLPIPYRDAAARTLALVARSTHPPP